MWQFSFYIVFFPTKLNNYKGRIIKKLKLHLTYSTNSIFIPRQSSCVNARGVPPAAQQTLALLFCLGGRGVPSPGRGVPQSCSWGWLVPLPYPGWGYPSPILAGGGGTPVCSRQGVPQNRGTPLHGTGVPPPRTGVPPAWELGYTPPGTGVSPPGTGVSPPGTGVPPWEGTWDQSLGYPPGKDMGPV